MGWREFLILRRANLNFIIGICLGITLGLTVIPLLEFHCGVLTVHKGSVRLTGQRFGRSVSGSNRIEVDLGHSAEDGGVKVLRKPREAVLPPLFRPRYASAELGLRKKLLVGVVLTDASSIGIERLIRINQTLRHTVDKLIFFVNGTSGEVNGANQRLRELGLTGIVPIEVKLISGVIDNPDLLAHHLTLRALNYFGSKFIDNFDYFFISLDRGYVSGRNLMKAVKKISVAENVLWGVPRPRLLPTSGTVACQIDFGFVISRNVLKSIRDRISRCWNSGVLRETHGTNVTLCLEYMIGNVSCRKEIQNQVYRVAEGAVLQKHNWTRNVIFAVPISTAQGILQVHGLFCRGRKLEIDEEIGRLRDLILQLQPKVPDPWKKYTWPTGLPSSIQPKNRFEVTPWTYFTADKMYCQNSISVVKILGGVDKKDVENVLKMAKGFFENKNPSAEILSRNEDIFEFDSGYRRFSPTRGMEYLLDFKQKLTGHHLRVQGLRAQMSAVEIVPVPFTPEDKRPVIVVPITKISMDETEHFLRYWLTTSEIKRENADIMLVLVQNVIGYDTTSDFLLSPDEATHLAQVISKLIDTSHPKLHSAKTRGKVGKVNVQFTVVHLPVNAHIPLGILDDLGKRRLVLDSALILFLEPNVRLKEDFLNRSGLQTISGYQVFSPIPFVEYEPGVKGEPLHEPHVNKDEGAFNPGEFRTISFYYSDYLAGRRKLGTGVNQLVTSADDGKALVEVFIKGTSLHVFRAVDPDLTLRSVTRMTRKNCDRDLDKCVGKLWGSATLLAKVVTGAGFSE